MFSLQYRGRIYKSKFSMRSFRYILSDQAARAFPALQRHWLFPVESRPIAEAAVEHVATPSASIGAPVPECLVKLGIPLPRPLQATQHFYRLQDTVVTGWAGAMMKDGLLLADGPMPNWASHLRARWHRLRTLPAGRRTTTSWRRSRPGRTFSIGYSNPWCRCSPFWKRRGAIWAWG